MTIASLPFIRRFSLKKPTSRCKPTDVFYFGFGSDPVRFIMATDLVVAPYETDNHSVLFTSLHTIHRTDLELWAIFRTQQRTEKRDLGLVPIKNKSDIDRYLR